MGERIAINVATGSFQAYIARPDSAPAPSVVVLHEVFGVNADMRQTCDDLAKKGFIAVCPDLFWRQEPGVDLGVTSEADWRHGLALYTSYDRDKGVQDVIETLRVAARLDGASGKAAVMGYCLGGLLTFLTAARARVDAAVAFHGGDTEKYLGEAPAIIAPLLMHLAEADEFISPSAQLEIKGALAAKANVQIRSYPGAHHAFSRHGGAHFDPVAAADANAATWAFLKAWLE